MKKRFIAILIGLAAVSVLSGCTGSNSSSETIKDKAEQTEERPVEESNDKPSGKIKKKKANGDKPKEEERPEDAKTAFEPVFSEIFEILDYGYNMDREYEYVSGGLTEKINYPGDSDLLKDIGYLFEDLNGDGAEELLIGSDEDYEETGPRSYIYGIYSAKDGKPVTVVAGSARSAYMYMGDGQLFYCGSAGAMNTIIGENHLNEACTDVIWDDFYFTDENENGEVGVYYNNDGFFDVSASKELKMSEDEFVSLMDEYEDRCKRVPWKPIGDIRDGGKTFDPDKQEESFVVDEEVEPYAGVLYWYKEIQDSGKSWEEMEEYSSKTELIQHGWPYSTDNNEVRYVYEDLTGDGYDELIITYYNEPVDIYSNEGDVVYSYAVPYRAIVELYPDGTLMEGVTLGTKGWQQTWYRYDDRTYKYVPVKGELHPEMSSIMIKEGKKIADVVIPDGLSVLE